MFLIDRGYPEEEDADVGIEQNVCQELQSGIREVLRASGQDELTLLGWCIGGTLCLMHGGLCDDRPARSMVLLSTPVDTRRSLYANWVGRDWFDVDYVADEYEAVPGALIDWAKQDDGAGHHLLDDVPLAVGERAERRDPPRGLPDDGAVDR